MDSLKTNWYGLWGQRRLGMDGFADVHGVCAHFDGEGNLVNHVTCVGAQDFAVTMGTM